MIVAFTLLLPVLAGLIWSAWTIRRERQKLRKQNAEIDKAFRRKVTSLRLVQEDGKGYGVTKDSSEEYPLFQSRELGE